MIAIEDMMTMAHRSFVSALVCAGLSLAALGTPVLSAPVAPSVAAGPSAPPTRDMESDYDLLDMTCGSFLATLAVANPGARPSPERQQAAMNAQAAAFRAMIWVHGYLSGKRGVDTVSAPLSRAWVVKTVPVVADQCKKDPAQLLFKAVQAL